MVDENGTPRRFKIEVNAEVGVNGSRNVIGEKAVLEAVVDGKIPKPKIAPETFGDCGVASKVVDANGVPKPGEASITRQAVVNGAEVTGQVNDQSKGVDGRELKNHRKREASFTEDYSSPEDSDDERASRGSGLVPHQADGRRYRNDPKRPRNQ